MNAKKRYSLILFAGFVGCCIFVAFRILTESKLRSSNVTARQPTYMDLYKSAFINAHDEYQLENASLAIRLKKSGIPPRIDSKSCSMESCFDKTRCLHNFKVYVYPIQTGQKICPVFAKILKVLKESSFYTEDPKQACLFVPSVDLLDRDRLSSDYVHDVSNKIRNLPFWNSGRNHIIFNLFSGTWPDYTEHLGFDLENAILAKASMSTDLLRPQFDISLPLFPKTHPQKGGSNLPHSKLIFPLERKYKLAFKGKRYLHGIGSASRNTLYHIHNDKDIILLTTCKHGKGWAKLKDERCDRDNALYDRYSYEELLHNSTFCLVPRGRRLGSYRFLEVLQAGCIPVLLSDGWELPFSELLDWKKVLINGDEQLLMQIPGIVRSYSKSQVLAMKQQALFLWNAYFSSTEKIVYTTLEVIRSRLLKSQSAGYAIWNNYPGALLVSPSFSRDLQDFPFYHVKQGVKDAQFTAVIYTTFTGIKESSPLYKLIQNVAESKNAAKILILWMSDSPIPENRRWPSVRIPLMIVRPDAKTPNSRFLPRSIIETDAILSLNGDVKLNVDEVDFAFNVWRDFPQRIVGFQSRDCYTQKHNGKTRWMYSSVHSNEFSIILTTNAFYHRYYNFLYTNHLPSRVHRMVDHKGTCEHIAMNFLVADTTRLPPIKILPSKNYHEGVGKNTKRSKLLQHFSSLQKCLDNLVDIFGYMPLIKSQIRLDPLLYKDPVSNLRKRYRMLESK